MHTPFTLKIIIIIIIIIIILINNNNNNNRFTFGQLEPCYTKVFIKNKYKSDPDLV